jgi:hypothetical protein
MTHWKSVTEEAEGLFVNHDLGLKNKKLLSFLAWGAIR